jgi:hypothetical protein
MEAASNNTLAGADDQRRILLRYNEIQTTEYFQPAAHRSAYEAGVVIDAPLDLQAGRARRLRGLERKPARRDQDQSAPHGPTVGPVDSRPQVFDGYDAGL